MIAKQFPRDLNHVTAKIQQLCQRQSLAQVAKYSYTKGGTRIEGESIHLANAILSAWGNVEAGWNEIERGFDEKKGCGYSECVAFCFDKETNYRKEIRFRVPHWRDTMPGTTANRPPLKPSLDSSAYHPARVIPGTIKPCRLIVACAIVVTIIFAAAWL